MAAPDHPGRPSYCPHDVAYRDSPQSITATWRSADGGLVFVFQTAPQGRSPCDVAVHVYSADAPYQPAYLRLPADGGVQTLDLSLGVDTRVNGLLYLRELDSADAARCAWGEFTYDDSDHQELRFDGCMVELPACEERPQPPEPEPKPTPTPIPKPMCPEPSPQPYIAGTEDNDDDLFPYIYLRHWPRPDAQTLAFSYVHYSALSTSPPQPDFIDQLEQLRGSSDSDARGQMEASAVAFLEGRPPYHGIYVATPEQLAVPMKHFPRVIHALLADPDMTQAQLTEALPVLLGLPWPQLSEFLHSPAYVAQLQRVWSSYAALLIILGYDHDNLPTLTEVLRCSHLLQQTYLRPGNDAVAMTAAQLQSLAKAPVLLPQTVFPLPPAASLHPSPPPPPGWIAPYAIGDLQLLRQRFLRYQAGDIAHIETIMAGERRTVSHSRAERETEHSRDSDERRDGITTTASEEEDRLSEQLQRTVTESVLSDDYQNLVTSYGPPTQATTSGTVTHSRSAGPNPGSRDRTRLARQVLDRSLSRIQRRVVALRSRSRSEASTSSNESVFDNSSGDHNRVGVYRWLNRIYQAYVVNYGTRLMLEFIIPIPARRFIAREQAQLGFDLEKPLSLEQQGIYDYGDITAQNSVTLAGYYGVETITPPPAESRCVSVTLRAGEQVKLAIPQGYRVVGVQVECAPTPPCDQGLSVLVGAQAIPVNSERSGVALFGEENSLPAMVVGQPEDTSPPSGMGIGVSVRARCEPTPNHWAQWQIATYNALSEAARAATTRYYRRIGERPLMVQRPPQLNRSIERKALKNDCLAVLLYRQHTLTGESGWAPGSPPHPVAEEIFAQPRYLQFFDEILEWNEMSYSFYGSSDDPDGGAMPLLPSGQQDGLFSAFLEAQVARVLVPARTERTLAMLYFLSSGMTWFGSDDYVAVDPADAALVLDFLQAQQTEKPAKTVIGEPWEVVVPTTMRVLDPGGFRADIFTDTEGRCV